MNFLHVNFESSETILNSFSRIAEKISNEIQIKINDAYYRIIDFEFYCFGEQFPDPHTYKSAQQLENGKIYLHASGLDITFGDGTNYGGILIRGLVEIYADSGKNSGFMKRQFHGPQKVATELFSNLHPLNSDMSNEIKLIDIQGHNQDASFAPAFKVIKTKRFGLTPKPNDETGFYMNLRLRYIALLQEFPNFKQNIKGIEAILDEQVRAGELTLEEAVKVLGYKRAFK